MKFRMVDRITDFEPRKSIRALKTVSFEEYQLKSAFAGQPCLPESLVLESIFQLGVWLIMLSSDFSKMGLLVRTQEVRFDKPICPGQSMLVEVRARSYRSDGLLFDGWALVNEEIIACGKGCLAIFAEAAEYFDPQDLKVLFSEIYKPDSHSTG
ncbi:MAG: hotdog family protein [Planctomycetota bacterium]|jgi:3-hydroxyacyl-[acyl-carrier-protein] dehydratase